ncbi:MAG: 4-(cytidine 5'-diphospho)-2-C-methyl-D-erythritol kinase [Candidatus Omnitrophica bacterium]|nr:4-(cytidine 5'-diphospho)-2-C-methyl-D-erythritol kinase [Candidatus Omnitrophota bacterium]
MKSLIIYSPAKINLDLRVTGKYKNGYHKLLTVFHRISLRDKIKLTKTSAGIALSCDHSKVPCDERNLIVKAYRMLHKRYPNLGGVRVRLTKNIPVQGGLGGGSSNAAFFLLAMKKLYRLKISHKELLSMGRRLGADVPFFLWDVNQGIGTGRGDRICPMIAKDKKWFVLIVFDKGLSTKNVFESLPKTLQPLFLTNIRRIVRIACSLMDQKDLLDARKSFVNDLAKPAFKFFPSIRRVIAKAERAGASFVQMSGSGPTVFAVFNYSKEARVFIRKLKGMRVARHRLILCHSI